MVSGINDQRQRLKINRGKLLVDTSQWCFLLLAYKKAQMPLQLSPDLRYLDSKALAVFYRLSIPGGHLYFVH
jgi:hypothetical protein